jgi:hypothetical protein
VTEFVLDFKEMVAKLPLTDSYDYEFEFGWQDDMASIELEPNEFDSKIPVKKNKQKFTE